MATVFLILFALWALSAAHERARNARGDTIALSVSWFALFAGFLAAVAASSTMFG